MFAERARGVALECAERLESEAHAIGILRSAEATRSAQWLQHVAAALREAAGHAAASQAEPEPDSSAG